MMQFRAINAVRALPEAPPAFIASVEIEVMSGDWIRVDYTARADGGGISDAILAAIAAGDFAGPVTDYAPPPPAPPAPPVSLQRAAFWLYLLTLGLTRADVHAALDAMLAAAAIMPDDAARLRIKIDDAAVYERLDPDLLDMAQRLGLAADQAALDAHFIAAAG